MWISDFFVFQMVNMFSPRHMPYPKMTETKEAETSTQNPFILTAALPTSLFSAILASMKVIVRNPLHLAADIKNPVESSL